MANFAGAAMPELGGPGVDWFDAVHLLPRAGVSFGVFSTESAENFDLFSAYREAVFLTGLDNPAPDSVDVPDLPSLPYEFPPGTSLRDPGSTSLAVTGMEVVALAATQAQFNVELGFELDVGTLTLDVSGTRVGVILPEADGEVVEKLEWSTNILPKSGGRNEQRIALRDNPRQAFEVKLALDGTARRTWANSLFGAQSALYALPLWWDRLLTTVAISPSGSTATVASTSYCDMRVGGLVLVYSGDDNYDLLEVATVTATTVTFGSGVVNSYPIGSQVVPVRVATVEPLVRSSRPPYQLETFNVRFDVVDNDTGAPSGSTSGWSTFGSRVLIDGHNVMFGNVAATVARNVVVIDNAQGQVYRASLWDRSKHGTSVGFSPKTRADLWALRTLLVSFRGPQTSFWIPTRHDDLVPTQNLTIALSSLVVENCGYTRFVNSAAGRNKVRITFSDGTTTTRGITAAVETSATEETLTVDSAWLATKTPAEVARIEFLELVRLDGDEVEIRHVDVGRATVQAPVMAVVET